MTDATLRSRWALRCLACAAMLAVWLPRILRPGMFLDGVTYAAIARNLAQAGAASLWHLHYTASIHPDFFEHPPLGMWLLALGYAAWGDTVWVETAFGGLQLLLCMAGVRLVWRQLGGMTGSWWPILVLCACPLTGWVFANNMLDGLMAMWCIWAVGLLLVASAARSRGRQIAWGVCAGLVLGAGLLSKGPAASFVLAALPLSAACGVREARRVAFTALGTALSLGALCGLLWLWGDAHSYLASYVRQQVVASVLGARETSASRFGLVSKLLAELAPPIVVALTAWGTRDRRPLKHTGQGIFLWALAFAASAPLLLSPKQSRWYLMPALPFYALAIAWYGAKGAQAWAGRIVQPARRKRFWTVLLVAMCVAVSAVAGLPRMPARHQAFHRDVYPLSRARNMQALWQACPPAMMHDWSWVANLQRSLEISLVAQDQAVRLVDLQAPNAQTCLQGCTRLNPWAERYIVCRVQ